MGFKNWLDSKPAWFRWGLKSWLYGLAIAWIVFFIVNIIDNWDNLGRFDCSAGVVGYPCGFFGFIINPFHWIFLIVYTIPIAIIGSIVGKLKSK